MWSLSLHSYSHLFLAMAFLVRRSLYEVAFEPSDVGSSIGACGYVTVIGFGAIKSSN